MPEIAEMEPSLNVDIIQGTSRAATLLQETRLRLIEELRRPDSASGLARRLGLPRQRVNYHLRELEKERLVEVVEERRKGNCTERILRAAARSFLISPSVLGPVATDPSLAPERASSAYLVDSAARTLRDVAILRERAEAAGKRLATLTMESEVRFASASDRNAFAEELTEAVARLVARYHDERAGGGRSFRVVVGSHPVITR
jgi:DNA-binding transcriptional ArsR family regulator